MKKLFVLLLLSVFFISFASAEFSTWDNWKTYDAETKTVTIKDLTGDIGGARLLTPLDNKVGSGYQKVAEFELWAYEDYNDILKSIDMYDKNQEDWEKHKFTRDFDLKYLSYEDVEVDEYENVLTGYYSNGTAIYESQIIGSHTETQEVWNRVTPAILKKNDKVNVGIFTEVEVGDYVEWIPTIYGVEVEEWATWTASLNVDIVSYYKSDDDLTTTKVIDSVGTNNGTATANTNVLSAVGIINTSLLYSKSSSHHTDLNAVVLPTGSNADFTISAWIYPTALGPTNNNVIVGQYTAGQTGRMGFTIVGGKLSLFLNGGSTCKSTEDTISINNWYHVVLIRNGGTITIWQNGDSQTLDNSVNTAPIRNTNTFLGAFDGTESLSDYTGRMDEVGIWDRALSSAEVAQLYNSGSGITYIDEFNQPPVVTLNLPEDNSNYTNDPTIVNFSCNASDDINLVNVSLLIDGVINQTNTSGINDTQYNFQASFVEGGYMWGCQATDNSSSTTTTENRTFFVHDTPPSLDVHYPTGNLGFNSANDVLVLNWTVGESGQNLTTHITNCTYDYNGSVTVVNNTVCTQTNETTFNYAAGVNTLTFNVTDEFGFVTSEIQTWDVNLTEVSQTYPNSSVEIATETYTSSVTYDNSTFSIITANLYLNGTTYAGTKTGTGNSATFSADAVMPAVDTETNFTAYWTVSLTDITQTINYNLSSNNVTVGIINMSLCGAPHTVPFWNFTVINESNEAVITSTFEATFALSPAGSSEVNTFSFAYTAGSESSYDFCISPSENNYTVSTAIKLTKSGFVDKFYNYQDVALSNATREDNLYMLSSGDSTSFIIHVVDTAANNIEEAEVVVQRYYQGTNLWATTEILTTNYVGEAVGHILSEDADYRFRVSLNGVSVLNSSATKITCSITPCTVTLTIPVSVPIGFEVEDLTSTLTYSDTTNTFTYTYSDSSGDFSQARLKVLQVFPTSATMVIPCNETKSTASGVITCDLTGKTNGTYRADGLITRDSDEFLDKRLDGVLGTSIYNAMGLDGVLWAMFVFMGIIMLGITRPSMAIIFGALGVVVLSMLQIINIGIISIIAIIAIAIILLTRVGRE